MKDLSSLDAATITLLNRAQRAEELTRRVEIARRIATDASCYCGTAQPGYRTVVVCSRCEILAALAGDV